jgi:tetratricopeptide (TPR) repeat protein
MNRYAAFLLDRANNSEKAESVLVAASQWGRHIDARSLNRGRTYELLARVELEKEDYASAERHAIMAIELVDDESSIGARRVLAKTLHRSGAHDAAVEEYIELIALDRGNNQEDINSVKLIVGNSERYRDSDLNALVAGAIAAREQKRRDQIEAEGAVLVTMSTTDHVSLEATLRVRGDAGAVLMIPDTGKSRTVWTPYAQLLGIDEISSLCLDLRGQGGSRSDSVQSLHNLPPDHFERLPDDIIAGFRYLRDELEIAPGRLVIVGEGRACAWIEKALRRGHLDAPVVYLSPVFAEEDRELADAISFHPNRRALVLYSEEDLFSLKSTSYFKRKKDLQKLDVKVFDRAGHGIDILRRDSGALETFQIWMRESTGVQ